MFATSRHNYEYFFGLEPDQCYFQCERLPPRPARQMFMEEPFWNKYLGTVARGTLHKNEPHTPLIRPKQVCFLFSYFLCPSVPSIFLERFEHGIPNEKQEQLNLSPPLITKKILK